MRTGEEERGGGGVKGHREAKQRKERDKSTSVWNRSRRLPAGFSTLDSYRWNSSGSSLLTKWFPINSGAGNDSRPVGLMLKLAKLLIVSREILGTHIEPACVFLKLGRGGGGQGARV